MWKVNADGRLIKYEVGIPVNISLQILSRVSNNKPAPNAWYELWEKQDHVKYVFRLFDSDSQLDWFSLFKIYETIRDDPMHSNNPKGVTKAGIKRIKKWISTEENDNFRHTANKFHRHSEFATKPNGERYIEPEKEMSLSEGNNLIRGLIKNWIEWKQERV